MSMLTELADAARTALERVGPATVTIGRSGRGSGVVVGDGRVVTNAHNLRDRTTAVTFADGRRVQARVAGVDADGDLVVLEVDTAGAPAVEWAERAVTSGDVVFALAGGHDGARIGFGLVSATGRTLRGPRGRRIAGGFEHSASLGRGASGGPVVDAEGRLVGIDTSRLEATYLALEATDELRQRLDRMAAGESPSARTLGVALAPPHVAARLRRSVGLPEREGLLVRGVEDDSPAAGAGIRTGDLLVRAGGTALVSADDVFDVLRSLEGDSLEIDLVRGVDERTVIAHFAEPGTEAETGEADPA